MIPMILAAGRMMRLASLAKKSKYMIRASGTQLEGSDKLVFNMMRFKKYISDSSGETRLKSNVLQVPRMAEQQEANKKRLRQLASSLAAKANKRAQRLEHNNLTEMSAYKRYEDGGGKFSVKGKSHKEVLAEIKRAKEFLSDETSTIGGVNRQAAKVAEKIGIKYKSYRELREKSDYIFKILPKLSEYLKMSSQLVVQYDSDQVIDEVTDYIDEIYNEMEEGDELDVEHALKEIEARITKLQKKTIQQKRTSFSSFYKP